MTQDMKKVEDLALGLPMDEREELARTLLSSLDGQALNEVDEVWIQEAERRLEELTEGKVQGIPSAQVIPEIKRELGWKS